MTIITECPHCKSDIGFEKKVNLQHIETIGFDGQVISVDSKPKSENVYLTCYECKKNVGRLDNLTIDGHEYILTI